MASGKKHHSVNDLVNLLEYRSEVNRDHTVIEFLDDNGEVCGAQTFEQLANKAKTIAAFLSKELKVPEGERALLLYAPGVDYVNCFFGCLYSGLLAVPAYPPTNARDLERLHSIIADAKASLILTSSFIKDALQDWVKQNPQLSNVQLVATDEIDSNWSSEWRMPHISSESIAFLQYTSGSTGEPKGVMVSHGNLIHNSIEIENAFGHSEESRGVIWLPPYHDMGLIGGVIQPVFGGFPVRLMSPISFLKKPMRWLQAISDFKATTSGGPNFAFELCVKKVDQEIFEQLDLSSWNVAFNGAEVIRKNTLDTFVEQFAPVGFKRSAYLPCYGLAESTLIASGVPKLDIPKEIEVQPESLKTTQVELSAGEAESKTLVGSGVALDNRLRIVNRKTLELCKPGEIGEIWIQSGSVAKGYWGKPDLTKEAFSAQIVGHEKEGYFLRSGDLGFLNEDELFVTGRIKEMILINGRNYYPVDIEATVQSACNELRPGCGAAFSVEKGDQETLVLVQELRREIDDADSWPGIVQRCRRAVVEEFGIPIETLVLIEPGSLPKTSSGKIRRNESRKEYLNGELSILLQSSLDQVTKTAPAANKVQKKAAAAQSSVGKQELTQFILSKICEATSIPESEIDLTEPMISYGLDSKSVVGLTGELEDFLKQDIQVSTLFDYSTIQELVDHLVGDSEEQEETVLDPFETAAEDIAIVGIGCRLPGSVNSSAALWQLLQENQDALAEVPPDRWNLDDYYDEEAGVAGKINSKFGAFLQNVDQFDANFFSISPREAELMDPQQRILLQTTWHAFENAGIKPSSVAGSNTGVFVGISSNDYSRLQIESGVEMQAYSGTGNALSIAANRLSYTFDLQGPSVAVDTACSSSLVALHNANQSLRTGQCSMAVVAGVNLILSPDLSVTFSQAKMLSPEGKCKTFSDDADGYVRGEGCTVVVLKRLSDAVMANDNIIAIVKGSAINQDGKSNGLTAPNGSAQEKVIRKALQDARVTPQQVSYVEAHGTGTALGDPIEVNALERAYCSERSKDNPLNVGSIKTNMGHLEAASGLLGLAKAALCLRHRQIPAQLHCESLSSRINWNENQINVVRENQAWDQQNLLAGVSSFGFGGTNAHVILQAAGDNLERAIESNEDPLPLALKLTSRSQISLVAQAENYLQLIEALEPRQPEKLTELCLVNNAAREDLKQRAFLYGQNAAELKQALKDFTAHVPGQWCSGIKKSGVTGQSLFLFTGQGAQFSGMGQYLYEAWLPFRAQMDNCLNVAEGVLGFDLKQIIFDRDQAELLDQTQYTQPSLYTFEFALAHTLMELGLSPDIVSGHSVGEYSAAAVAGVFSYVDGLKLIAARGRLMQELEEAGGMLAIMVPELEALKLIAAYGETVSIGAVNGPNQVVLSGRESDLDKIAADLAEQKIKSTRLQVSHGFHSPLMQPMLSEFKAVAESIQYSQPTLPVISNVTGQEEHNELARAEYWVDHVCATVRFGTGIKTVFDQHLIHQVVEIGPKPVLNPMAKRCLDSDSVSQAIWLNPVTENGGINHFLKQVGHYYVSGNPLAWDVWGDADRSLVADLPEYRFEGKRYWFEMGDRVFNSAVTQPAAPVQRRRASDRHPLIGNQISSPVLPKGCVLFETYLSTRHIANLEKQCADQTLRLPPTVFFEMALEAGEQVTRSKALTLAAVESMEILELAGNQRKKVQVHLKTLGQGRYEFSIFSQWEGEWTFHVKGQIIEQNKFAEAAKPVASFDQLKTRFSNIEIPVVDADAYYKLAQYLGYSPDFKALERLWMGELEAFGQININQKSNTLLADHIIHPTLIDSAYQVLWACLGMSEKESYLPTGLDALMTQSQEAIPHNTPIWIYVKANETDANQEGYAADLSIFTEQGELLTNIKGITLKQIDKPKSLLQSLQSLDRQDAISYLLGYIAEQLANGLKCNADEIDIHAELVDLGLDSLIAMDLLNHIEDTLGIEINIMELMKGLTLIGLSERVYELLKDAKAFDANEMTNIQRSLVEFQSGDNSKLPIFFVHPIGGSVFCYSKLAKLLGPEQGFYGLQNPEIGGGDGEYTDIKAMAADYIQAIKQIQPEGPYCLGGWSLGAVIAYEVANQLKQAGDEVKSIALVDGLSPSRTEHLEDLDDPVLLKILALDLGIPAERLELQKLENVSVEQGLEYIFDLGQHCGVLPNSMPKNEILKRYKIFKNNYIALINYEAPKLSVDAMVFRATEALEEHKHAPIDLGWSDLDLHVNRVITLPGSHFTLVSTPGVDQLARELSVLFNPLEP